jgi:hypothetical protein
LIALPAKQAFNGQRNFLIDRSALCAVKIMTLLTGQMKSNALPAHQATLIFLVKAILTIIERRQLNLSELIT